MTFFQHFASNASLLQQRISLESSVVFKKSRNQPTLLLRAPLVMLSKANLNRSALQRTKKHRAKFSPSFLILIANKRNAPAESDPSVQVSSIINSFGGLPSEDESSSNDEDDEQDHLSALTVKQLRQKCASSGLTAKGNKS